MTRVYLGLGSNLGDRLEMLRAALRGLSDVGRVVVVSSVYETAPWGDADQPLYLNCCCALETTIDPAALLAHAKGIESKLGRRVTRKWGPREIDIDILCFENLVIATSTLTLPHPYLADRAFVLAPLAEIAPELLIPGLNSTVSTLFGAFQEADALVRVVEPSTVVWEYDA